MAHVDGATPDGTKWIPSERVKRIQQALESSEIAPHYDEALHEVAARIREAGSASKSDIAVLTVWKRLRADTPWVTDLLSKPDADVRTATAKAVQAVREAPEPYDAARAGRAALKRLPGFAGSGNALPSALLCATDPVRLPVYDVHAHAGLGELDMAIPQARRGVHDLYARYTNVVDQLRREGATIGHEWTAHQVDVALFVLGRRGAR